MAKLTEHREVACLNRCKRGITSLPIVLLLLLCNVLVLSLSAAAQEGDTLEARIQKVMSRPEYAHSTFAIEFLSLDSGKPIYRWNADKLVVPGSTTKLLTEGTALELFTWILPLLT